MGWVLGFLAFVVVGMIVKAAFSSSAETVHWEGPDRFEYEVVGESNYQSALENICGGRTREGHRKKVLASLVLEDGNRHDKLAVRVDISGRTVGYLSREDARSYRRRIKSAGYPAVTATCDALILGGWKRGFFDKGSFGVRLDIPLKGRLKAREGNSIEKDTDEET